jgi:hypothetical protein
MEKSFARFKSPDRSTVANKMQKLNQSAIEGGRDFSPTTNGLDVIPDQGRKFLELYDDALQRLARKDHVYAYSIERECTFKPKFVSREPKH